MVVTWLAAASARGSALPPPHADSAAQAPSRVADCIEKRRLIIVADFPVKDAKKRSADRAGKGLYRREPSAARARLLRCVKQPLAPVPIMNPGADCVSLATVQPQARPDPVEKLASRLPVA